MFSENYKIILGDLVDNAPKESVDKINIIAKEFYDSLAGEQNNLAEALIIFSHCLCLYGQILEKELGIDIDASFFKTV